VKTWHKHTAATAAAEPHKQKQGQRKQLLWDQLQQPARQSSLRCRILACFAAMPQCFAQSGSGSNKQAARRKQQVIGHGCRKNKESGRLTKKYCVAQVQVA